VQEEKLATNDSLPNTEPEFINPPKVMGGEVNNDQIQPELDLEKKEE